MAVKLVPASVHVSHPNWLRLTRTPKLFLLSSAERHQRANALCAKKNKRSSALPTLPRPRTGGYHPALQADQIVVAPGPRCAWCLPRHPTQFAASSARTPTPLKIGSLYIVEGALRVWGPPECGQWPGRLRVLHDPSLLPLATQQSA